MSKKAEKHIEIIDKTIVASELIKSFHEQFAQNQNHQQKLFLQVLTVLLTVLIGFGYLYIRVGVKQSNIIVTAETIYSFLALSMFLLSLAVALILNMSLSFRRDQLVACNIRVKVGVMNIDDINTENFFPSKFNPVGKDNFFTWMPEFHQIFFYSLFVVKILLIVSLVFNSSIPSIFSTNSPNKLILCSFILFWLSFILDFLYLFSVDKKRVNFHFLLDTVFL